MCVPDFLFGLSLNGEQVLIAPANTAEIVQENSNAG
jgi:hypothetical protein